MKFTKTDIFIYGGRTWKGPKPLGRNLWGSNLKRAETSGNRLGLQFVVNQSAEQEWSFIN